MYINNFEIEGSIKTFICHAIINKNQSLLANIAINIAFLGAELLYDLLLSVRQSVRQSVSPSVRPSVRRISHVTQKLFEISSPNFICVECGCMFLELI